MLQWIPRALKRPTPCERTAADERLKACGWPYVRDVFLLDAEGGVHIPHLLLTPEGFCIFELQCMQGTLYGSEHGLRWSRFERGRRHDFDNPLLDLRGREAHLRRLGRLDSLDLPSQSYLVILGEASFHKAWPGGVVSADVLGAMLDAWRGRPIASRALTAWRVFLSMFVHEPVNSFGQRGVLTVRPTEEAGPHV